MVLLVVDTQEALVNEALYRYGDFVANIRRLIQTARQNGVEVVYVVHDDGPGSELTEGCAGFAVFGAFAPQPGERVFVKHWNSAFRDTGLAGYLTEKGEKTVVVAGLQTDKCINATVIGGFERGFAMVVPAGCNSTVDNPYMDRRQSYEYYNAFLWPERFAACPALGETIAKMERHT